MQLRRLFFEYGGLLGACAFALYAVLAPTHIVNGDNAEFSTLASTGGVAHPSGYPAYVLWLRLLSWLPGATPAHTAALATAILGAAQIVVLHAACRAWGARTLPATCAVAIFAGAPTVLRLHTEAEVFALNGLVVAGVLWFSAREAPLRGVQRAAALGLVAGLGIANHLTCALLAPLGFVGVVRGVRESSFRALAGLAAAFVFGLLPYVYLLVAPETDVSWGRIDSFSALLDHFLRMDYGGPGAFSPAGTDVAAASSIRALFSSVARIWLWLPLAIGLVVLGLCSVRRTQFDSRSGWAALAASVLLAGPLLAVRFNVEPEGLGLYICQRFHVLPALLLTLPIAVGFDRLGVQVASRVRIRSEFGSALAVATIIGNTAVSLPRVQAVHTAAVENGVTNLLRSLPPRAVLLVEADDLHFGVGYLQGGLGERTDVTVVSWGQLPRRAYRERLARREQLVVTRLDTIADLLLSTGRPVFVDPALGNLVRAYPTYPYGLVSRVLPRGAQLPDIEEVFSTNRALFGAYVLDYPRPNDDHEHAAAWHRRYSTVWLVLARALRVKGHHDEEQIALKMAGALAPGDPD